MALYKCAIIIITIIIIKYENVLWTREGVHAKVVTAGHCTHAAPTSGHTLASCYSCCMHSLPDLC